MPQHTWLQHDPILLNGIRYFNKELRVPHRMEILHWLNNIYQGCLSHLKEHPHTLMHLSLTPPTRYMHKRTWDQRSNQKDSFVIQNLCSFSEQNADWLVVRCGCGCHPTLQPHLWNIAKILDFHKYWRGWDLQQQAGWPDLCRKDTRRIWIAYDRNIWIQAKIKSV